MVVCGIVIFMAVVCCVFVTTTDTASEDTDIT